MNAYALSGLSNFVLIIIFGFFVFFNDRKNKINQHWLMLSLVACLWEFGVFRIGLSTVDPIVSLFWWRVAWIGAILIPVAFTQFVYTWQKIDKDAFYYFAYAYGLVFSAFNFIDIIFNTGFFIPGVKWAFNSFYYNDPSIAYTISMVLWFFILIFVLYRLLKIRKVSNGTQRNQIAYFIFAFLVAYSGGATNFLPVYNYNVYPYLNFTASIYHIIMAYAIVVHRLMDLKFVLRRYSVWIFSIITITIPVFIIKLISEIHISNFTNWVDFFVLILAISVFPSLRNYFYKLANKYFFTSLYDSREVITSISEKLRSTLDSDKIYQYVFETLSGAFHSRSLSILIYDQSDKAYHAEYQNGNQLSGKLFLENDNELNNIFFKQNRIIVIEEAEKDMNKLSKPASKIINTMSGAGVEILAPLNAKNKAVGLIALGAKESGDIYNDEDLKVLEIICAQTAISIENASLYNETLDFNMKLEAEVKKATREFRDANAKLKILDRAKSDFISIASHQLRTPLTVIKGYISMILEGSFGQVNQTVHTSLEKVYDSNERLIKLVENLLNISRIESGRLQFNYEKTSLETLTESVIDELMGSVIKKKLELSYKKPPQEMPLLMIDAEKVRQVIMNLVDNAIKYTKKGLITITLEQNGKEVKFCVADTGMGMNPDEIPSLFRRFVRGYGTSLIHTEGTGLGLFVARKMIEAHKGNIWAESEGKGMGSRFCFRLPIDKLL